MNSIKAIRERLGETQDALGDALGCTQGNVWHLEQGQTVTPDMADRLIAHAKTKGLAIDHRHIYAGLPLPKAKPEKASA